MNPFLNLFFLCWLGSVGALSAQHKLFIRGATPNFFLEHKVVPKENWYSVGRVYNVSAAEIARFNKLKLSQSLKVDEFLKIPLGAGNFSQDAQKTKNDLLIPLYHQVNANEWMYRISVTYNKVPIPRLEKWNQLTNAQLHPGLEVIVGYLKVKKGVSSLTAGSSPTELTLIPSTKEQVQATEVTKPAVASSVPAVESGKSSSDHAPGAGSTETIVPVKPVAINFKGGVFKKQYLGGQKSLTGNAGIFRSTSGWNDGKYYALMNEVPAGTIIKVFFSSTNKSIYAKVLGPLPEMKESVGLALRLSDASASELAIALPKFFVEVSY